MSNQTFKEGDNVFHAAYGWGKVMSIDEEDKLECPVEVEFYNWGCETFTDDGRTMPGYPMVLSFTAYTLEGFSQERPEELPTKGQIVWVRDWEGQSWFIAHYVQKSKDGYYVTHGDPLSIHLNGSTYRYLTTKNPYANEK
jgi:hypothetical protein